MRTKTIYIIGVWGDRPVPSTYHHMHDTLLAKIKVRYRTGWYSMSLLQIDNMLCDAAMEAYKNNKKSITITPLT